MRAKPKFRLMTRILLLALVNVGVLAGMVVVFVSWQLGQDFESFLLTTARERIFSETRSIALDLRDSPQQDWTQVLAEHSARNGVEFLLYDADGKLLAGKSIALPPEVLERVSRDPRWGPGRTARSGPPAIAPPPPPSGASLPPDMLRGMRQVGAFFGGPVLVRARSSGSFPHWVGIRTFLPPPEGTDRPVRGIFAIASPTLLTNPFFFQMWPWLGVVAVGVLVSVLCWVPLVRSLTRSIGQMTEATARIAEGDFDVPVVVKREDELGLLGASIQRMAARLGAFTHGQKRFLGDVAHELRSPLGRMQLALGILERKVDDSGRDYVRDLADDVRVMTGLTDGLLDFAKAEMRATTLELGPVNASDVVWRAVKAEGRPGVQLDVRVDSDLLLRGETESVFRAVANVIRNAVRYAGEAGPIAVAASRDGDAVIVVVRDEGPGVPEAALDRIFEPFFRLEEARDRESGGAGLGLAIVKSCVEACGGRVSCRNRAPRGLEVSLSFDAA